MIENGRKKAACRRQNSKKYIISGGANFCAAAHARLFIEFGSALFNEGGNALLQIVCPH
jgi:hypothetical protein